MLSNTVLLDVDGVLANFVQGIIATHRLDLHHDEYLSWDYHLNFGITDEEFWDQTNDGSWWLGLEPYPWATLLVRQLKRDKSVIFCTSPSLDSTCPSQKVQWLRNNGLMGLREINYQIGSKKELNAASGAILIDDSDRNVRKYREHGGKAILFPQPWNENRTRAKLDRVQYVFEELNKC